MDEHLCIVRDKVNRVAGALLGFMTNIGGPRSSRHRLYASVVDSILLYGAPAWSEAAKTHDYVCRAASIHRRACLRVICGFCTISNKASYVVASIPPLELLIDERSRCNIAASKTLGMKNELGRSRNSRPNGPARRRPIADKRKSRLLGSRITRVTCTTSRAASDWPRSRPTCSPATDQCSTLLKLVPVLSLSLFQLPWLKFSPRHGTDLSNNSSFFNNTEDCRGRIKKLLQEILRAQLQLQAGQESTRVAQEKAQRDQAIKQENIKNQEKLSRNDEIKEKERKLKRITIKIRRQKQPPPKYPALNYHEKKKKIRREYCPMRAAKSNPTKDPNFVYQTSTYQETMNQTKCTYTKA
ncbi:unnamed protein product [Trichogramma brassicae]|uniref:Uncharacterized protein n=1 Tax=Trichogramma brassicae TaxID=86971 RepID=A0A6H5HWU0_9HYME|nr:unnamed protein product [Trichogramma brassicae]